MLDGICKFVNNYFVKDILEGDFTISGGALLLPECKNFQYFRIKGSTFNNGIYQYPTTSLMDEDFTGEVWILAIPNDFLELDAKITAFEAENTKGVYSSESFGGYSYTKFTNSDGTQASWQDIFKKELDCYRRI